MLIQAQILESQVLFRQHAVAHEVRVGLKSLPGAAFCENSQTDREFCLESGFAVERIRSVRSVRILRSEKLMRTIMTWRGGVLGAGWMTKAQDFPLPVTACPMTWPCC